MPTPIDPYAELLAEYVKELRSARAAALQWWDDVVDREATLRADRAAAERAVRTRWPLGPTSYPRVIAVYRKYYLRVDEINKEQLSEAGIERADPLDPAAWIDDDADDEVLVQQPRAVLYERLDEIDTTLARFLDAMIFIPIGADRDGRLV